MRWKSRAPASRSQRYTGCTPRARLTGTGRVRVRRAAPAVSHPTNGKRRAEMTSRVVASVLTVTMALVLVASAADAQNKQGPKQAGDGIMVPITGTTSTGGTFSGMFNLQRFAANGSGGIVA